MTVFRFFFTVFRKNIGMLIMYSCIFFGIVTAITKVNKGNDIHSFESVTLNVAYFNHSKSAFADRLIEYLQGVHNLNPDYEENINVYRDEIYNRNIDYVLIIPEDFEYTHNVEAYKLPGSVTSIFMDLSINNFIQTYLSYKAIGMDDAAAYNNTVYTMAITSDVAFSDNKKSSEYPDEHYYYIYMAYILIEVICLSLSPVLITFNRDEIKLRTVCSGLSMGKRNAALTAGCLIVTCCVSLLYAIMSIIMYRGAIFSISGAIRLINMFVYSFVALSFTFLISTITRNQNIVNMYANVIGLGSSFICGVFVPRELLGKGVLNFGRIFPAYWYVDVEEAASNLSISSLRPVITGISVQVLYAVIILIVSLIIGKRKKS